jgi:uncharacterized protein YacL
VQELKRNILVGIVFVTLSLMPIIFSEAPFRVHLIDALSLFIAFVVPSLITSLKKVKKPFLLWIIGAIIGILFWDIFSSFVITKKEIFMSWYIVYPIGIISLLLLQITVQYISNRLKLITSTWKKI